jgi:hypothetical protein
MTRRDISPVNPDSKPSEQLAPELNQDKTKTEKIFRIKTTVPTLHARYSYVAAKSAAEARRIHEDGLSVDDRPDQEWVYEECLMAEIDAITDEPVEVTDPRDLEYARKLIAEEG